jgi:hypothetical protein
VNDHEHRCVEVGRKALEQNFERADPAGGPHDGDDVDGPVLSRRRPSRSRPAADE